MQGFILKRDHFYSRQLQHALKFFIPVFLIGICNYSVAHTTTTIGRYLTVENKPSHAQQDLLSQTIQVRFPQTVQTVGDAMAYVLRLSGYSLVAPHQQSAAFKTTLTKPLPAVDRNFGPMSLRDALTTLAGPAFNLVTDPLNRTVNFGIKPYYASEAMWFGPSHKR